MLEECYKKGNSPGCQGRYLQACPSPTNSFAPTLTQMCVPQSLADSHRYNADQNEPVPANPVHVPASLVPVLASLAPVRASSGQFAQTYKELHERQRKKLPPVGTARLVRVRASLASVRANSEQFVQTFKELHERQRKKLPPVGTARLVRVRASLAPVRANSEQFGCMSVNAWPRAYRGRPARLRPRALPACHERAGRPRYIC